MTTKGWPDAVGLDELGKRTAIEATHSERVLRHLRSDVAKLEQFSGEFSRFVFVAWADRPLDSHIDPLIERAQHAGVASGDIHLVFRKQLVRDLRSPAFARVWSELLSLPMTALPFKPIEAALSGTMLASQPLESFASGRVPRHSVVGKTLAVLGEHRLAAICDRSSTGKTVAAVSIAADSKWERSPVYYLDFAVRRHWGDSDTKLAAEVILTRGAHNVLFVLDNAHLQPDVVAELCECWELSGGESCLLLVGRPPLREALAALESGCFGSVRVQSMSPDPQDVRRVGAFFVRMELGDSHQVDSRVFAADAWSEIFKADIVAFATAARDRARQLVLGDDSLPSSSPCDYVRRRYLHGLTREEREVLLELSALALLEVGAVLPNASSVLGESIGRGIVALGNEDMGPCSVRLCHPALASLILEAAASERTTSELQLQIARRSSSTALAVMAAHLAEGNTEAACSLLEIVLEQDWDDATLAFREQATLLETVAERFPYLAGRLDRRLVKESSRLVENAEGRSVSGLGSFLFFLGRLGTASISAFAQQTSTREIARNLAGMLVFDPPELARTIAAARVAAPELASAIVAAAESPRYARVHASSANALPLSLQPRWFAESALDFPVAHEMGRLELRAQELDSAYQEHIFRQPEQIAPIFRLSRSYAPALERQLSEFLGDSKNADSVVLAASRTGAGGFVSFVAETGRLLPEIWRAAARHIQRPLQREALMREIADAFDHSVRLVGVLQNYPEGCSRESSDVVQVVAAEILSTIGDDVELLARALGHRRLARVLIGAGAPALSNSTEFASGLLRRFHKSPMELPALLSASESMGRSRRKEFVAAIRDRDAWSATREALIKLTPTALPTVLRTLAKVDLDQTRALVADGEFRERVQSLFSPARRTSAVELLKQLDFWREEDAGLHGLLVLKMVEEYSRRPARLFFAEVPTCDVGAVFKQLDGHAPGFALSLWEDLKLEFDTLFSQRTLLGRLEHLAALLSFVKSRDPNWYIEVVESLSLPRHATLLSRSVCRSTGASLAPFLSHEELARATFSKITLEDWTVRAVTPGVGGLRGLGAVLRFVLSLENEHFASTLARQWVQPGSADAWKARHVRLRLLGQVARALGPEESAHLERFINHVLPPEWFLPRLRRESPGGAASAMFWVWLRLPEECEHPFGARAAGEEIRRLLSATPGSTNDAASLVALLGVSDLLRVPLPGEMSKRLPGLTLTALKILMLAVRESDGSDAPSAFSDLEFWHGLSVLARHGVISACELAELDWRMFFPAVGWDPYRSSKVARLIEDLDVIFRCSQGPSIDGGSMQ